jgi:hypothetical protein
MLADADATVAVPRDVLPVKNVVLSVGTPIPEPGVTFAVMTTAALNAGIDVDAESVIVVPIKAGGVFVLELPFPRNRS